MADASEVPDNGATKMDTQDPAVESTAPEDLEGAIEGDIAPATNSEPAATNLDGANDAPEADKELPAIETRIPAKKDASLREFLSKMDDYAPIVRPLTDSRHTIVRNSVLTNVAADS